MEKQISLGKTIRTVRHGAGLTQVEFGKRVGVSGYLISNLETGKRSPSFHLARRLNSEFRIDPF